MFTMTTSPTNFRTIIGLAIGAVVFGLSFSLALVLMAPTNAQAQSPVSAVTMDAFGFESITVSTAAIGPTAATRTNAKAAFCTVETAEVRYRFDGGDPTSSIGHLSVAAVSNVISVYGLANVRNLRFIRVGSDSTVRCTYSR